MKKLFGFAAFVAITMFLALRRQLVTPDPSEKPMNPLFATPSEGEFPLSDWEKEGFRCIRLKVPHSLIRSKFFGVVPNECNLERVEEGIFFRLFRDGDTFYIDAIDHTW